MLHNFQLDSYSDKKILKGKPTDFLALQAWLGLQGGSSN